MTTTAPPVPAPGWDRGPVAALSHLDESEAEAVAVLRETVGQFARPAILFSGGKDSMCALHLAARAFAPSPPPFTLLHVDTGHNFPEVIEFRDRMVAEYGLDLVVARVQDYLDSGALVPPPDGSRNRLQTTPLLDSITEHQFDAVVGGGRRDEEKARAKERVFSLRDEFGGWDPRRQRPEVWQLYNGHHAAGEHVRVFPLSDWTELDVWRYIAREGIALPEIYFSHTRQVFRRDGAWLAPGDWGGPTGDEQLEQRRVRYRTVGDMSCTGAVESTAATVREVIAEIAASRTTERGATRVDDRRSASSMEDRKREGYF